MPKTLNPVNAFPTSIPNFPLSGNNEPLALGPLEAAIQAVLNRTENLHQSRLTVEGAGVKRVQRVASLTALQNLAGMSDGDTVDVEGYGRYRLYNPSALTADGLWVLTSASGGRWVHLLNLMRGGNSGLATLTSAGRLAQDVRDASVLTQHLADQAVTTPKLAPGSVVGHLGYTPVNRAGDTMTGALTVPSLTANSRITIVGSSGQVMDLKGGSADHVYMGFYARASNQNTRTGFIGFPSAGSTDLTIANEISGGRVLLPGGSVAVTGDLSVSGNITGRYDAANRFVVSANVGGNSTINLNPGTTFTFYVLGCYLPTGKSLVLRRARYYFVDANTRLRILGYTTASNMGDITPNVNLVGGANGETFISIAAYNAGGAPLLLHPYSSVWLEFEIV